MPIASCIERWSPPDGIIGGVLGVIDVDCVNTPLEDNGRLEFILCLLRPEAPLMLLFEPPSESDIGSKLLSVVFRSVSGVESYIWGRVLGGCCAECPRLNSNVSLRLPGVDQMP